MITGVCTKCEKKFLSYRSDHRKYCSLGCYQSTLIGMTLHKGYKHSDESKNRMSLVKKGKTSPMKGRKMSEESKERMRVAQKKLADLGINRGSNCYRWIPDRTKLVKRQERNDMSYQDWRKKVWTRDKWKCRIGNQDCKGRLEAHHILGWTAYPDLRYNVDNGITLCHFHHPRKRSEETRLSPYFQEIIKSNLN